MIGGINLYNPEDVKSYTLGLDEFLKKYSLSINDAVKCQKPESLLTSEEFEKDLLRSESALLKRIRFQPILSYDEALKKSCRSAKKGEVFSYSPGFQSDWAAIRIHDDYIEDSCRETMKEIANFVKQGKSFSTDPRFSYILPGDLCKELHLKYRVLLGVWSNPWLNVGNHMFDLIPTLLFEWWLRPIFHSSTIPYVAIEGKILDWEVEGCRFAVNNFQLVKDFSKIVANAKILSGENEVLQSLSKASSNNNNNTRAQ